MHDTGASGDVVYAGFLRRWAALFLDQLILTGALYGFLFVLILAAGAASGFQMGAGDEPPPWMIAGYVGAIALFYVCAALYYTLMESSAAQATIGKMALGIKVTDEHGGRLTRGRALARWAAAALSYLTLYIGFLVAAFTERKQALHDLVAKTLVVDKWAYTDTPERQQRGLSGCLIAFLLMMGLMFAVAMLGILAAIAIPAYADYANRAKVAGAVIEAEAIKRQVDAATDGDDCPTHGSGGFGEPESYASPSVAKMDLWDDGGGHCGFTLWLPASGGGDPTDFVAFTRDPAQGTWACSSNLPDRSLPATCR